MNRKSLLLTLSSALAATSMVLAMLGLLSAAESAYGIATVDGRTQSVKCEKDVNHDLCPSTADCPKLTPYCQWADKSQTSCKCKVEAP